MYERLNFEKEIKNLLYTSVKTISYQQARTIGNIVRGLQGENYDIYFYLLNSTPFDLLLLTHSGIARMHYTYCLETKKIKRYFLLQPVYNYFKEN